MIGVRRAFVLPELLLAIKGFALKLLIFLRRYRAARVVGSQTAAALPLT